MSEENELVCTTPLSVDLKPQVDATLPRQRWSAATQVVRLLCGHVHCPVEVPWAGTVATTMPSVAVDLRQGVEAPAGDHAPIYHLHQMTDAGLVSELRIVTD